jgi:hypothetical protein
MVDGLKNGSLIWVTDGSYDRKKAKDLCRVGWMIFCTNTGFRLTGTFWERSPLASLYRAKLLGLCALHLLAQALAEFYQVVGWSATLCCDNKRALEVSSHHKCRIRPSAKCADIRRNLKAMHFVTYTYTAIWTDYSNGSNSRYPSNSTAYATLWQNARSQQQYTAAITIGRPSFFQKKMWH